MPRKPWTPERRWNSLVEAGVVDAGRSASDLTYVMERLHSALAPTMWEHARAKAVRNLYGHAMDLVTQRLSGPRVPVDGYARLVIERLLSYMLGSSGPLTRTQAREFCAKVTLLLPESAKVIVEEAALLLEEGRHEDSEQLLACVLTMEPENERALSLARAVRLSPHRVVARQ